jgi:hypothetical protein
MSAVFGAAGWLLSQAIRTATTEAAAIIFAGVIELSSDFVSVMDGMRSPHLFSPRVYSQLSPELSR